jgi:hypothetical protein
MCDTVHGIFNGSGGDWDDRIPDFLRCLEWADENWKPSEKHNQWKEYDDAVRNLIKVSIKEAKAWVAMSGILTKKDVDSPDSGRDDSRILIGLDIFK